MAVIKVNSNQSGFAHESVTADSTAGGVALTESTYFRNGTQQNTASSALITTETADCRFTIDGTAPTTTVGHLATSGSQMTIDGLENIKKFRAIRTGDTSATLKVTYYNG
jgi:hypothetical protein